MKNLFFALLLLPTVLIAQTKGFRINGNITGIEDGTVKLTSTQDANQVLATGQVTKGVFTLEGTLPEPGLFWLALNGEQPLYIYLENSNVKVTGTKANIKNLTIEGSSAHKDFDTFQDIFNPLIGNLNAQAAQLQQAEEAVKPSLMKGYDSIVNEINVQVGKFIEARTNSYVSPFVLFVTAQLNKDYSVLESRYALLSDEVRNSNIGRSLSEFITFNKVGTVGTMALDFTQNDTAGKPVSFSSSYKGKYVLVDFWASWCRPCRVENPNVVDAFNKFKSKNFTVLGISLDREKDAWMKAIEKDNLKWTHLSDLNFWNNEVAMMYRVNSIPQNFLVDPSGKIVAKDLRGEELHEKLCELLGCK
jgi:peroxiredoxin